MINRFLCFTRLIANQFQKAVLKKFVIDLSGNILHFIHIGFRIYRFKNI